MSDELSQEQFQEIRNRILAEIADKYPDYDFVIPNTFETTNYDYLEHTLAILLPRDQFAQLANVGDEKDAYWRVRGLFNEVVKDCNHILQIKVEEQEPKLIPAELGNFVLVHQDSQFKSDEDSDVGIVSSKIEIDGKIVYGCRKIDFNDRSSFRSLSLQNEEYWGYKSGFIRILTVEEVIAHLGRQIYIFNKQEIQRLEERTAATIRELPKFLDSFKEKKQVSIDKLLIHDEERKYRV